MRIERGEAGLGMGIGQHEVVGLFVSELVSGGAGDQAGVRIDDIFAAINGEPLGPDSDLAALFGKHEDHVNLALLRGRALPDEPNDPLAA